MRLSETQFRVLTVLALIVLTLALLLGVLLFSRVSRPLLAALVPSPTPKPTATQTPTPWPTSTPTASPTPTARPSATATATPTATPPSPCVEALQDPGFETGKGWTILSTAYKAGYVGAAVQSQVVHGGAQALRLGIAQGEDTFSYSSAEQTVTIPADVTSARLSYWVYLVSAAARGDLQYVLVLDETGVYRTLAWQQTNAPGWQRREFSLDAYRGQRVTIRFGVRNNGDGALTTMYVDDVSLTLCTGVTPTPVGGQ